MLSRRTQKFVLIPILILVLLGPVLAPFASSFSFPDRYDLVAIVVEQNLYADEKDYEGLVGVASGPIEETTLKARIDRYAVDLQNALPGTRAVIIQSDRFEKTSNIAGVLEKLYFEGDPEEPNRIAYLRGVVVIGEVPLPVVNKNGSRFISLFPYTDFEQKAYVWSQETQDFEIRSENLQNPQPEVWHGVITPPQSTQTPQGKQMIAQYFDKNHLYHLGDPKYAQFDKKMFFQDFIEENKNLNAIAYKNYLNFLNHQGDVAYLRYTKELYKDLVGPIEKDFAQDEEEIKSLSADMENFGIEMDTSIPPADSDKIPDEVKNAKSGKVDTDKIPDILTKIAKMSDNLMFRFNQLFLKYPNLINDFVKYTGRYEKVDSAVNLITAKDQYTIEYLKSVNTAVEGEIDEVIGTLQKNIAIGQTVEVKLKSAQLKSDNGLTKVSPFGNPPSYTFTSFSPKFINEDFTFFPDELNGLQFGEINDVSQCSLYRGSKKTVRATREYDTFTTLDFYKKEGINDSFLSGRTPDEKEKNYSCYVSSSDYETPGSGKVCAGFKTFNECFVAKEKESKQMGVFFGCGDSFAMQTAENQCFTDDNDAACEQYKNIMRCTLDSGWEAETHNPYQAGNKCEAYEHFGGCFYGNLGMPVDEAVTSPKICFPEAATDPVFDIEGTMKVAAGPVNYDNYKACLDFYEKDKYVNYLNAVNGLLEKGSDEYFESTAKKIKRINNYLKENPLPAKMTNPDFQAVFDMYDVSLGDVLRGLGWDSVKNPNNWQTALTELLVGNDKIQTRIVDIAHPQIAQVEMELKRKSKKEIPSVFYHKEPTNETLNAQAKNFISRDLPIDAPRYVTFQDADEKFRKIVYPDLFTAESFEKYQENLVEIEKSLACENCLTEVFNPLTKAKVVDSLFWKDADIDSKHISRRAYVGEPPNGYEFVYFNGEGNEAAYEFSLNKDNPEEETKAETEGWKEEEKSAPYSDDPKNPFDSEPSMSSGYDLFSWKPPPKSPWWEKVQEWKKEQKAIVESYSFGDSDKDFYGKIEAGNKKALEEIQKESSAVAGNLSTADQLDFSKIAKIELSADSLVVGEGKRADVTIKLKDKKGELVNDEFAKLALTLEGEASFSADTSNQITMLTGTKKIGVVMSEKIAELKQSPIKLKVNLENSDKTSELLLTAVADAKIVLDSAVKSVLADGKKQISVDVSVVDGDGKLIEAANNTINLSLSDPLMGALNKSELKLVNGKGSLTFTVGKKKGDIIVNALSPAFDSGFLAIKLLPGEPEKIILTSDKMHLRATLYDDFGNAVDTNSGTEIKFGITEQSKAYGSLSSLAEKTLDGSAEVDLIPTAKTGDVQITAESPGLKSGSTTVKLVKRLGMGEIANMKLDALVGAFLGIPAGNVTEPNYLGGSILAGGRMQAAASLTSQPKLYKKLFEINDRGGMRIFDKNRISAPVIPANNFSMILRDNASQSDIARMTMFVKSEGQFEVTDVSDLDKLADGIYLRKIIDDENYKVDRLKGALRVAKNDSEKIEVQTNGFTRILDNNFSLRLKDGNYLILEVLDKDTPVAEIYFVQRFNQDVGIKNETEEAPGVYIEPFKTATNIFYQYAFTGNTSIAPRGVAFYDKSEELSGLSAPGFNFNSFEDSRDKFGIGFTQDNKFALSFSAGETFGEANRQYASDIGIVLGDPTVRINNKGKDIGKLVYAGSSEVRGLLNLDYNIDGFEDILIVQNDGKIRLIQNNGGYDQLKDQGFILDIKNGIQDFAKADFNNDGQIDLVIAGKVSCRKGDTCIDVYENQGGAFTRNNLHFNETAKIVTVKTEDLNQDSYVDLILADASGNIKVLYNRAGKFDETAQEVGNVGLQADPNKNLITSVLVKYEGMDSKNSLDPVSLQKYKTLDNKDFIYADLDIAFAKSTKFAQDLNGGIIEAGDLIRYTITLKNDSGSLKKSVEVSDLIADKLELDMASVKCVECAPNEMTVESLNSSFGRPYLFKNISVPAKSSRTIVYEGVFKGDSASVEKIKITFSGKFKDTNPAIQTLLAADDLPDLAVTKEGNSTGQVRYFYTNGISENGSAQFGTILSSPPELETADSFAEKTGLKFPKIDPNKEIPDDKVPAELETQFHDLKTADKDGDGLQDTIDDLNGGLDKTAEIVSAAVEKLTCDAGCIALPVNYALAAPGFWSQLGVPVGFDTGTPVFGWGAPSIVPIWPPTSQFTTGGGRFYISPTATGGVGFSLCIGPYLSARNCFSFGINPLDMISPGVCDKINGGIGKAMSKANDFVSKVNEGVTMAVGAASGGVIGANKRESEGSGMVNYSLGSYESPATKSVNIKIPGFPSVITDWWDRQLEEILDKALDIPDLYIIYPDGESMSGRGLLSAEGGHLPADANFMNRLLTYLNSMPILDIETEPVTFKIPFLTKAEIEKVKADVNQWMLDEQLELDKWRNLMGCVGIAQAVDAAAGTKLATEENFANLELCKFVSAEMEELMKSVVANVKALDEWILFPKKILQFRSIEAFYLNQIIDYMDTINKFIGGWTKKNISIVRNWIRLVRQIKDIIENWKMLVDLMVDYNESCDKCKTERYGLKDLILKLFVGIPSPPVIPIPKLPDVVIDVSKIQAGIRVKWPDVRFKPEPFTIPRLPRIGLGINLTIPIFKLMLPEIPVIDPPPPLPSLPMLPPLPLPKLPNLPPAPTLPPLPGEIKATISILKKIVKILCIITLGFTPTDEIVLKQKIEEITARGLTPLLPVDFLFSVTLPTISVEYVDQIIATAFSNFQIDTSFVADAVKDVANTTNKFSTDLTKGVNKYTDALSKQLEKYTSPKINIDVPGPEGKQINLKLETVPFDGKKPEGEISIIFPFQKRLKEYRDQLAGRVADTENLLGHDGFKNDFDEFNKFIAQSKSAFRDKSLKKFLAAKPSRSEDGIASDARAPSGITKIGELDLLDARTLAYKISLPPEQQIQGLKPGEGGPSGVGSIENIGIFVVDENGESNRLINYTLEATSQSKLADIDLDNDGDTDKIYSYGNNVFIKRNDKNIAKETRPTFRPVDIEIWTIFELMPKGFSPNFPKILSETAHDSNFTFESSQMENIAGFEIIANTIRAHLLKDSTMSVPNADLKLELKNPDGEVLLNDVVLKSKTAQIGDYIETKDDSSVTIQVSDGTLLKVSEDTGFKLNQGGAFELLKGEVEITLPKFSGALFSAGTVFIAGQDAEIRLRFFDGSDVVVQDGQSLVLPDIKPVYAQVKTVNGKAMFTGGKREYIEEDSGKIKLKAGQTIHPLEVTEFTLAPDTSQKLTYTLSKNVLFPVAEDIEMEVEDGFVEIINTENTTQPAANGMALVFSDQLDVNVGSVVINYAEGGDTVIGYNEKYILDRLSNMKNPTATLKLDPAFYFAKIYAFDGQGNRSTSSEKLLLAPQICGDNTVPFANAGKSYFSVAIGKTLKIDAGKSFDTMSNIISYALDVGDGKITKQNTSVFTVGPYEEVGQKQMKLIVEDEALNEGYQDIIVDVITPKIVLDPVPLRSGIIEGHIEPAEENAPITIAMKREGDDSAGWEMLVTPSADPGGQYYTNSLGKFKIEDADLKHKLVVENAEGKAVAEINETTGKITVLDDIYETRVMTGSVDLPMRIGVFLKTDTTMDNPLTYIYLVPDVNTDTTIDKPDTVYNAKAFSVMSGVHVKPLQKAFDLGFSFSVLPADDPQIPGATEIKKDGMRVGTIDVNGDISLKDPDLFVREKQDIKPNQPIVFELLYKGDLITEIFIAAHSKGTTLEEVNAPSPPPRPKPIPIKKSTQPFDDIASGDPFALIAQKLFKRGIIAGYPSTVKGELLFKPENLINRAEFTQITLKMLCIAPRPEAYKLPPVFYDVLNEKIWFYPALKEGNIRGFIKGYIGEAQTNPTTGETKTPFKPANSITRAEAATVVLAALAEENVVDVSKVDFSSSAGQPWYMPYIALAQDIKLLTAEEAKNPDEQITREQFAIMADRVLLIHDCYGLDADNDKDGLPDIWEKKFADQLQNLGAETGAEPGADSGAGLMPTSDVLSAMKPDEDLDGDTCSNKKEYEAGSDPFASDTDEGGVADCIEINRGTDPVNNPYDDKPQLPAELLKNEEGIFIIKPLCDSCPCRATVGPGATMKHGDTLFATLTGKGGIPIYAKSNEEQY